MTKLKEVSTGLHEVRRLLQSILDRAPTPHIEKAHQSIVEAIGILEGSSVCPSCGTVVCKLALDKPTLRL
jgi:hypothetical protein